MPRLSPTQEGGRGESLRLSVGYFNFNDSDDIYPGYRADLKWINLGPDVLQNCADSTTSLRRGLGQ